MQKILKTVLSIFMLLGGVVVFIAIITQRINLIIGLPLVVIPVALALINFFPDLITGKKNNTIENDINEVFQNTEINQPEPEVNNAIVPEDENKTILATGNDVFLTFLTEVLNTTNYTIYSKERLDDLLVYNRQDPGYSNLANANIDYLVKDTNQKLILAINIYDASSNNSQNKQLAKLFGKAKIPLLVLHNNQLYSYSGLKQTIFDLL